MDLKKIAERLKALFYYDLMEFSVDEIAENLKKPGELEAAIMYLLDYIEEN